MVCNVVALSGSACQVCGASCEDVVAGNRCGLCGSVQPPIERQTPIARKQPSEMNVKELKEELKSVGICFADLIEKHEFVAKVVQVRGEAKSAPSVAEPPLTSSKWKKYPECTNAHPASTETANGDSSGGAKADPEKVNE